MHKNLKIMSMLIVIACVVFSAGCTGNTQSTQNPSQGTPDQKTNQPPSNDSMMSHHRSHMNNSEGPHMNGSERPYWNNTSGRPHFNGSERPYMNNTSDRPYWNSSEGPYLNNTS